MRRPCVSLSVNGLTEQTVGIPVPEVNVRVLVPALALALRTIVFESVIDEIVVPEEMPVPLTSIPTANLLESTTVRLELPLAVQDCSVVTLITQSVPSSPDNNEEKKTVVPSCVSF